MKIKLFRMGDFVFYVRMPSSDVLIVKEVIGNMEYLREDFRIGFNDIVIDIGAQIGSFSILAASFGARVYAYEPFKDNYDLLVKNILLNDAFVIPYNVGVMGKTGKRTLYIEELNYGGCNFYNNSVANPSHKWKPVECITLDDIYNKEHLDHCDFLKLDCQGAELEILKNFSRLNTVRKIALEYDGFDRLKELKEVLTQFRIIKDCEDKCGVLLLELKT